MYNNKLAVNIFNHLAFIPGKTEIIQGKVYYINQYNANESSIILYNDHNLRFLYD